MEPPPEGWKAFAFDKAFDLVVIAPASAALATGFTGTELNYKWGITFALFTVSGVAWLYKRSRERTQEASVRDEERKRIRDNVVSSLRRVADELPRESSPSAQEIAAWRDRVAVSLRAWFHDALANEFVGLLEDVEKRIDAVDMWRKAVIFLHSTCDRVHYVDIKRLPHPR